VSLAYFPFYPVDYEADTAHLSLEEDGAYNRLLRLCWMTPGCSLPDDPAWIMRRLRVDAATYERVVSVVLSEFFKRRRGRVYSPRLAAIFEETNAAHKRRVNAGKKGGRPAKSLKNKEPDESNDKALPKQPEPEPEPYTVSNETDGEAVTVNFTKEVFDRGVAFLARYGMADRNARSIVAKWRKEAGDTETFNALRDASREGVTDPVAWISARLRPKAGQNLDLGEAFAALRGRPQ
jgi:uncharacterized protein YdaU (DUF1376 family)